MVCACVCVWREREWLCMSICVILHSHMCWQVHVSAQRPEEIMICYFSPHYSLYTGSLTEPGAGHVTNKLHWSSYLNLPQYGGHRHLHAHTIPDSHGYWDPNLDPHAYVLNTLAQRAISPPHALIFETGSHYAVQTKNFLETLESPWVANDSLEPTIVLPPLPGS